MEAGAVQVDPGPDDEARTPPAGPLGRWTWAPGAAFLALAVLWHVVGRLTDRPSLPLGVPTPPFLSPWDPGARWGWLAIAALTLLPAAVVLAQMARRLPARWWTSTPVYLLALLGVGLAARLLVAAIEGEDAWFAALDPSLTSEGRNEYLASLQALSYGRDIFLDNFAEWVPALSVHVAGHPPGLLLAIDAFDWQAPRTLAKVLILGGALTGPLTYALARALERSEEVARAAGLLAALAPSALIMGAVSADALFAAMGAGTAALLCSRRWGLVVLGGAAAGVSELFAYSLLGVPAFCAIAVLLLRGWKPALLVCVVTALGVGAVNGWLAYDSGFDPIGTVQATSEVYREGIADIRPYWYWVLGSPIAAFVWMGLPLVVLWLRGVAARDPVALALLAIVLVAALAGFTKAETERIWLFMVPLAAVAAAAVLPPKRLALVAGLLVAQALVVEVLFRSPW